MLQNRGAYVAACLTIARAYKAAGAPKVCRPLGSYGEWSEMIRAPLIWLGEADPIESMETAREEDPELSAIRELFGQLPDHFGEREWTTAELIKIACEREAMSRQARIQTPGNARAASARGGRRRRGVGQAPGKVAIQDQRASGRRASTGNEKGPLPRQPLFASTGPAGGRSHGWGFRGFWGLVSLASI